MIYVTRVAKAALEKALAENDDVDGDLPPPELSSVATDSVNLERPLLIKTDNPRENHES